MATEGRSTVLAQWEHAVAGCTAGLSTVLALQPLDVVKTRLQVQDGAGALPVYRGTRDALQKIFREEGWRTFYSGLTPALLGSGVAWGLYFFAYNRAKERYQQLTGAGQGKLSPFAHLASAAEAGSIVCFVTNPIWVVKTRLQLQRQKFVSAVASAGGSAAPAGGAAGGAAASAVRGAAGAAAGTAASSAGAGAGAVFSQVPRSIGSSGGSTYTGFVDCLYQIATKEGVRGLYKGLLPSLFLVSHGAIQFAVYEELKSAAHHVTDFVQPLRETWLPTDGGSGGKKKNIRKLDKHGKRELTSAEITACGALSKLAASVATYPSQVIRARLQQRMETRALKYSGVMNVVRTTLAREGVRGLYKGLLPNVLRVMPQSALTFLVYESVIKQLNSWVAATSDTS